MTKSDEWEGPFFKILAKNDSGEATGNQSGVLIPKDLGTYFPDLSTIAGATPSVQITADLFFNDIFLARVETRYQYQTWGGDRNPERRITGNISELMNRSKAGDIFLIERNLSDELLFQIRVVSQNSPLYAPLVSSFQGRRWGVSPTSNVAVNYTDVERAYGELEHNSRGTFSLFDQPVQRKTYERIIRDRAFRKLVSSQYSTCAFCGLGLRTPDGSMEMEAAHIVSISANGSNDIRNGLALCRTHHWAFDKGLLSISEARSILVSAKNPLPHNSRLLELQGRVVVPPADQQFLPALEALAWHRKAIFML